jgi:hypothetical protein
MIVVPGNQGTKSDFVATVDKIFNRVNAVFEKLNITSSAEP